MGNVPTRPSRTDLPMPKGELLEKLTAAGFVFGEPSDGEGSLTYSVTVPADWIFHNDSPSMYNDYVNFKIADPTGEIVASVSAKITSHDYHASIWSEEGKIDLLKGEVRDGWFYDNASNYHDRLRKYRRRNGTQAKLDAEYEWLKKTANELGVEFVQQRIVLGSPEAEGLKAMASLASGVDIE
jgi:hypothetical protein